MPQTTDSRRRQRGSNPAKVTVGKLNSIVNASFDVSESNQAKSNDSQILFEGNFGFNNLGLNIQVHVTDALAVKDVVSTAVIEPAFTVLLLLEGEINASLGKLPLNFSAKNKACGQIWSQNEKALFRRTVVKGERVRKVNISLPTQWLENMPEYLGINSQDKKFNSFVSSHLAIQEWTPSTSSIRCAEDIIAANNDKGTLKQIATSMWAYQILFDAFSQINEEPVGLGLPIKVISERNLARTRAARDYINTHIKNELSLDDIANNMNMSVATLQRLFKQCFGTTVIQYVRFKKLDLARQSLIYEGASINQAGYIAGYNNSSNFSTAFQREFGYPPSHCLNSSRHNLGI